MAFAILSKNYIKTARDLASVLLLLASAQSFTASAQSASDQPTLKRHYFLIVWAYQGPDDDLVHAHTFASFYRGDDLAIGVVRPATISWLPATGAVQLFGAERGYNFSLGQTLRMACQSRRKVKAWGPYEVKAELFRSAMRRIQVLESGQIRYSMINALPRSMNCITAAGDITPVPLDTGILWGDAATAEVVRHLSPYFVGEGSTTLKGLAAISTAKACPGQAGQVASSANKVSIP
jgi:hypothetical protein